MRRPLHNMVSLLLLVMLMAGLRGVRHECVVAVAATSTHADHSPSHEPTPPADDCGMLTTCGVTLSAAAVSAPVFNPTIPMSDLVLTDMPHQQPVLPHDTPPPRS